MEFTELTDYPLTGGVLTEWLVGKMRAEISAFEPAFVDEAVGGLRMESKHAAVLCRDGVRALLKALV